MGTFILVGNDIIRRDAIVAVAAWRRESEVIVSEDGEPRRTKSSDHCDVYIDSDDKASWIPLKEGEAVQFWSRVKDGELKHLILIGDSAIDLTRLIRCPVNEKPMAVFRLSADRVLTAHLKGVQQGSLGKILSEGEGK